MNKNVFKIDNDIINELDLLMDEKSIEVDDVTLALLNSFRKTIKEQKEIISELNFYKGIQLSPFSIGDAISDGICVVDNKGIVVSISKGYTDITGITEEEILGKNISMLIKEEYFSEAVSLEVIKKKRRFRLYLLLVKTIREC